MSEAQEDGHGEDEQRVSFANLRSRFEAMAGASIPPPPQKPSKPLAMDQTQSEKQEDRNAEMRGTTEEEKRVHSASLGQANVRSAVASLSSQASTLQAPPPPIPRRPRSPSLPTLLKTYPGAIEALAYADSDRSLPATPTSTTSESAVELNAPSNTLHEGQQEAPPVPERPNVTRAGVYGSTPDDLDAHVPPFANGLTPSSPPASLSSTPNTPHFDKSLPPPMKRDGQEDQQRQHGMYEALHEKLSNAPNRFRSLRIPNYSQSENSSRRTSVPDINGVPSANSTSNTPPPRGIMPPPLRRPDLLSAHGKPASQQSSGTSTPHQGSEDDVNAGDSSESEEVEAGVTSAIGTSSGNVSARMSDELPDVTRANRRPPHYLPHRSISTKGHIACLAVYDDLVVSGHHDRLRTYRASAEWEAVSHVISLGNERREIKVTAMIFRPIQDKEEGGRFLWCGTKEGDLVEYDIKEQRVASHRTNAHTAPVVLLERVGKNVISLDESGKICTWLAKSGPNGSADVVLPSLKEAPITQRIVMDRHSCPMVLGQELWVASAGEMAGSSIRSCKVRIFRPFSIDKPFNAVSRPVTVPESMGAGSSLGLISCGTVVPLHPNHVYLGHQSGHVSVWNTSTYSCVALYPIGMAGVTTMSGIRGYHLWTGSRQGQIRIFDVREAPWQVIKVWDAQKSTAVTELIADCSGIDKGRLQVLSASLEGDVHLWDGLLTSDWMTLELERRLTEYSTFRQLSALHITFNIDASTPMDFESRDLPGLELISKDRKGGVPDVIIVGFQELVDLQDTRIMAKSFLLGGGRKSKGHDVGERLSHQARAWTQRISTDIRKRASQQSDQDGNPISYQLILQDSLVGLYTAIFIREHELPNVHDSAIASIKTGFGGRMGNKGAIIASMRIDDTPVAWANCHLAAGQQHTRQRNADLVNIFESMPFSDRTVSQKAAEDINTVDLFAGGGDGTMLLPDHEIVFLSGDLNYRIDLRRDQCIDLTQKSNWQGLLARDQLLRQLRDNKAHRLRPFHEAPIAFPPTYKFDRRTSTYDTSEKQRVPAYCDRILWFARTEEAHAIQCIEYTYDSRPGPSDHRAVIGSFSFRIRKADPVKRTAILDELRMAWKVAQAERLRAAKEFYSGQSDEDAAE